MKQFDGLFRRRRDEDLSDEIEAHLAMAAHDRVERGEGKVEAEAAARREFGNRALVQEVTREMWRWGSLERLWQDIRFGLWTMRRSPGFTTVAVLSLALGIGANTAILTLIEAVMSQWLPVKDPARLVLFYDGINSGVYSGRGYHSDIFSYPFWEFLKKSAGPFEDVCAFRQSNDRVAMHLAGASDSEPDERAEAHLVAGNYFRVLGVSAAIGRTLRLEDDAANAVPVAVISYRYWQDRFHSDSGVVGKSVVLNGTAFTLVGVAAREFFGERIRTAPDFWLPLAFQPQVLQRESWLAAQDVYWLNFMGRLKPGDTAQHAAAVVTAQLQQFFLAQAGTDVAPSTRRKIHEARIVLKPGGTGISGLRDLYSEPLHMLMAVVGIVLLIACANIATLLLARAAARRAEFMTRLALGAAPGRIMRQVLTESVLLSLTGGLAGIIFAWWSLKGLVVLLDINPVVKVRPDPAVLIFTLVITLLTGLLYGVIPAWRFSNMEARSMTLVRYAEFGRSRFGSTQALIVVQVALSCVLLVGAGLLARSLLKLETQEMGFQDGQVLIVSIDPQMAGYQKNELFALYRELNERLNQIPGVVSASLARYTPESGNSSSGNFSIEGYTPSAGKEMNLYSVEVGPHFFETLRTPLLMGREIGERDTPSAPLAAVVNQKFVDTYFPGQSPLGKRFSNGSPLRPPIFEIVGVAANERFYDVRQQAEPMAYLAAWQAQGQSPYFGDLLIRTSADEASVVAAVRRALFAINKKLIVVNFTRLDHQVEESLAQQKLITDLSSVFGFIALLLAAIGIYGTVAYAVSRRTFEIGVRIALGAQRQNILAMILRESVVLTLVGVMVGLPLAFAAARWIKGFLFGVKAADPLAIAAAIVLIALVSLLAGYIPAARATKTGPAFALRYE